VWEVPPLPTKVRLRCPLLLAFARLPRKGIG
jgi:hypothetical protein